MGREHRVHGMLGNRRSVGGGRGEAGARHDQRRPRGVCSYSCSAHLVAVDILTQAGLRSQHHKSAPKSPTPLTPETCGDSSALPSGGQPCETCSMRGITIGAGCNIVFDAMVRKARELWCCRCGAGRPPFASPLGLTEMAGECEKSQHRQLRARNDDR